MKASEKKPESKKGKRSQREILPWSYPLFAFAAIAGLLFVFLSQYAILVRTQYSLVEEKAREQKLLREQSELELRIQQLTSLERIEEIAVSRLKMSPPPQREVLDLGAWEHGHKTARGPVAAQVAQAAVR